MKLPIFKSDSKDLMLLQTKWAGQINPVINSAINNGQILQNVQLTTGLNVINHLLGRKLQGWFLTRVRSPITTLFDSQSNNPNTEQTLILVVSNDVLVDIMVF